MNKTASLTPESYRVIVEKGTEAPNTGEYNLFEGHGTYICRQCGHALFRSSHKFLSSCGWPSFDDEIEGAIQRKQDSDGRRTEILCQQCDGHLGHVFSGEYLTSKNLRHCVNSCSVDFVRSDSVIDTEEAIVAGGCFWGVEALLKSLPGVILTEVGYTGGSLENPDYKQVCGKQTGHLEAVRVVFDKSLCSYEDVVKMFFECHDPTQADGQGNDRGPQYLSAVFVYNEQQREITDQLILQLSKGGLDVVTKVMPVNVFWPAEIEHQSYYEKTGGQPYCHARVKRF